MKLQLQFKMNSLFVLGTLFISAFVLASGMFDCFDYVQPQDYMYFIVDTPHILRIIPSQDQPIGSMLFLPCNVMKGARPIKFQWLKDDRPLSEFDSSNHYQIETKNSISNFIIPEISADDSGNYSCVASNEFGFDSQWTFLQVKGLLFVVYYINNMQSSVSNLDKTWRSCSRKLS